MNRRLKKAYDIASRYIDFRSGFIGAFIMATIVFAINYYDTYDLSGATTASLKQGAYTFLFGGFIMKACEYLATRIKKTRLALMAAVIIPSVFSITLLYGVHSTRGTPKPLESTIPTAVLLIPATMIWGYRKRKKYYVLKQINI